MAHVGKFYPVAFRRDFNLNLARNQNGYGRAYRLISLNSSGTVGVALRGKKLYAIARDEPTTNGIQWRGDYESYGGRLVRWEAFMSGPTAVIETGPDWRLVDSVLGTLAIYRPYLGRLGTYETLPLRVDFSSISHPSIYDDQVLLNLPATAVLWEEYHDVYG